LDKDKKGNWSSHCKIRPALNILPGADDRSGCGNVNAGKIRKVFHDADNFPAYRSSKPDCVFRNEPSAARFAELSNLRSTFLRGRKISVACSHPVKHLPPPLRKGEHGVWSTLIMRRAAALF
jgi:hypothetical protein